MKKILLFLSLFTILSAGCDVTVSVGSTPAPGTGPAPLFTETALPASITPVPASATAVQVPPTASPAVVPPTPTPVPSPVSNGVEVSVGPLHVVLPPGLASGARGSQFPRADGQDVPYWEITPGHNVLKLEGYPLQGRSLEPQIYVYPAQAYAEMFPAAFESMHRLDNVILGDPGAPLNPGELPAVPFFDAQQAFAAHVQVLAFQNGRGIRFLTEYAQYPVSANNHDLVYHFQGLTADGAYYVVVVLPISAPVLAETSDGGAVLPSGGVPYPYFADPNADMQSYYASVIDVLNATPSELFSPTLDQLDALIGSIQVTP